MRRDIAHIKRSIKKGIRWAAFEPNTEALWAKVRRTITDLLLQEWRSGALLGAKPEEGFFVKCDRSTMTQNDIDKGPTDLCNRRGPSASSGVCDIPHWPMDGKNAPPQAPTRQGADVDLFVLIAGAVMRKLRARQ